MGKCIFEDESVWEQADVLAMAIRLRVAGVCPPVIDDMLGQVIMEIVKMATKLLLKKEPSFISFSSTMFSQDVQSELVCLVLRVISSGKVRTDSPRSIVNLFIKTAQNRLINIRRNIMTRYAKAQILTESEYGLSNLFMEEKRVANIKGEEIHNNMATKKEVRKWERE